MSKMLGRSITISALLGLTAGVFGSIASYQERMASLPAFAYGPRLRYFTTSLWVVSLPVEAIYALYFAALLWLMRSSPRAHSDVPYQCGFALSIPAVGGIGGLLLGRGPYCVPTVIAFVSSLAAMLTSISLVASPSFSSQLVWRQLVEARKNPRSVFGLTSYFAMCLLVAQFFWVSSGRMDASTSRGSDSQFLRWYASLPRSAAPELVRPGEIRVVVFSDFQCPACNTLVPQFDAVISGMKEAGLKQLTYQTRDFPLDSECNPLVRAEVHPGACEAAVAMRLVKESSSADEARRLADWYSSNTTALSRGTIRARLDSIGLSAQFDRDYTRLVDLVRADAELGRRFGVYSTPTVFINGARLPGINAIALESALKAEMDRTPSHRTK